METRIFVNYTASKEYYHIFFKELISLPIFSKVNSRLPQKSDF